MATLSRGQLVPYGERSVVEGAGVELEAGDYCKQCGNGFEVEVDHEDGVETAIVVVPVENPQGKLCSKSCEAKAFYEAADEETRGKLRRLYLGALLIRESLNGKTLDHLTAWDDLDCPHFESHSGHFAKAYDLYSVAGDVLTALSTEGAGGVTALADYYLISDEDMLLVRRELNKNAIHEQVDCDKWERLFRANSPILADGKQKDLAKAREAKAAIERAERVA